MADKYKNLRDSNVVTSLANYLKSESQYNDQILTGFIGALSSFTHGEEIKYIMDIFKRE